MDENFISCGSIENGFKTISITIFTNFNYCFEAKYELNAVEPR